MFANGAKQGESGLSLNKSLTGSSAFRKRARPRPGGGQPVAAGVLARPQFSTTNRLFRTAKRHSYLWFWLLTILINYTLCHFCVIISDPLTIGYRDLPCRRIKQKSYLVDWGPSMRILASRLHALWAEEAGISSVEYALLLAMAAGGIILGADILSSAVSGQFADTASCFDGSADANGGKGSGTGDGGGSGGGSGDGAGNGDGFAIC